MFKHTILVAAVAGLVLALVAVQPVHAAVVTWDIVPGTVGAGNGTITGGTGAWNTSNGNWTTDAGANNIAWVNVVGTPKNDAIIGGIVGTVTLGEPISLRNLTFNNTTASYTITGSTLNFTGGTITAGNPPAASVNAIIRSDITGSPALVLTTMGGDEQFTLNPVNNGSMSIGIVSGSGGAGSQKLNLQGGTGSSGTIADVNGAKWIQTSGAWTLNGDGSYGYGHAISGGTLTLNANLQASHRSVTLSGTGVINYNVANAVTPTAATSGAGTDNGFRLQTGASIDQTSGAAINTSTTNPSMTWEGNWTFIGTNGALSNLNLGTGNVFLKAASPQVTVTNAATTLTVGGVIANDATGGRGLTKAGAGTLELRGASTYTGATTVTAGKLLVNNTTGSGTGSGAVAVNSGGILGGTGIISGAVTINAGGHYAPGNSVGTQTVGSLTMSSGSIYDFEFNTTPANDKIIVTTSGGLTIDGGGFNLYAENTTDRFSTNGTYSLIGYTGAIGGTGIGALTQSSILNPDSSKKYTFSATGSWVQLLIEANAASTTYNLATTAGNVNLLKGGTTSVTSQITNGPITGGDTLDFTGLNAHVASGTGTVTGSTTSGGPLAQSASSSNTGLSFTSGTYGTVTLDSLVASATNHVLTTSATAGVNPTTSINVGNATADMSNSPGTFGTALTAPVLWTESYAGLESMVYDTVGGGGAAAVGSTATILAGDNTGLVVPGPDPGLATVSMAWRTRTTTETTLVSDVVELTGMDDGTTGETDIFVLQMTYDPDLLSGSEGSMASAGHIYLAWLDPGTSLWTNAVLGNSGGTPTFAGVGAWSDYGTIGDLSDDLGRWGVDLTDPTHAAWAVVNHNSKFAVVPEPATMVLLGLGGLGLILSRKRR